MRKKPSVSELWEGILSGNRAKLSQAITRMESNRADDRKDALALLKLAWPSFGRSKKIGITGSPGVGKSSFLESFGCFLADQGNKIAVLAVDPSSTLTQGSILGDKTRMEKLSVHPMAYIRPSASGGTLGGVHAYSQETMLLLEAFGFDYIFLETVGVGQSEIHIREMVDFFLLLMLSNAGDELQGIKKGIMEMADAVVITKEDIDPIATKKAKVEFQSALHYITRFSSAWQVKVESCSSAKMFGMKAIQEILESYFNHYFIKDTKEMLEKNQKIALWKRSMQQELNVWLHQKSTIFSESQILDNQINQDQISVPDALSQWNFILNQLKITHG